MCLHRLRFEPFPCQLEAAARVLRHMQGKAISAAVARAAGMRRTPAAVAARYETTAAVRDRVTRAFGAGLRIDRARGW